MYSRDVSGREMAIYQNNSLLEYPTYGLDMIGKIKDDELHFYLKDHLGSIRATVYDNKLISAQDYDAWGYILEGRTYESEEGKFKFTGKERDEESFYDYFGARYYDARVGRWGQVDPSASNYIDLSPYVYTMDNPLRFTDYLGKEIDPTHIYKNDKEFYQQIVNEIYSKTGFNLEIVNNRWQISSKENIGSEEARTLIKNAIISEDLVTLRLLSLDSDEGTQTTRFGQVIYLNKTQILERMDGVMGGLDPATNDTSMFLMHELIHSKVGTGDLDPEVFGIPGDVEDKMNVIRFKLGLGHRESYIGKEIYGVKYLPFDNNSLYDLKHDLPPRDGSKYIKFYKNYK